VTDIITPYMAVVFGALAGQSDLTVIFCAGTGTRAMPWRFEEGLPFPHRVVGGLTIRRRNPDATDYYLTPRILFAIASARPDGVVAAGYSVPTVYAYMYCASRRRPLVIHSDGTSASETGLTWVQEKARAFLLPRASACVANSEPAAARFREMGVAEDRLFLARHSTNLEPLWKIGRDRSYEGEGPMRLLAVGRLIPRKGFDRLLRALRLACERGADITLTLVGLGPSEDELRALTSELGVDERVEFAGFVDQDGLPERYGAADAFAFPSLDDPFGFVLLEAMAAGLPVVSSPLAGATPDLVVDGANGLVADPNEIDATAGALARLATDRGLRERLGQAAHAATLSRTAAASAAGYVQAVTHAIEHPGSARGTDSAPTSRR
jgi:glycosyltransferase involved in cell wall biosynthesis